MTSRTARGDDAGQLSSGRQHLATVAILLSVLVAGCSDPQSGAEPSGVAGVSRPLSPTAPGSTSSTLTDSSTPTDNGSPDSHQVAQDQTRWTLPLDPYYAGETESLRMEATSLVTTSCMHDAGLTQFRHYWDAEAPLPQTLAGNGIGQVFTEELAAAFGYRQAPDPRYLIESALAASGGSLYENESAEFVNQKRQCQLEAARLVDGVDPSAGGVPEPDPDAATSQMDGVHADQTTGALAQAGAAWRQCMAPQGIADLPDQPWEPGTRIPESLVARWGWTYTGAPSSEEIEVATADAACRRSSGWFDALYQAEWEIQQRFVDDHRAELDTALREAQSREADYRAIIAQYSGAGG